MSRHESGVRAPCPGKYCLLHGINTLTGRFIIPHNHDIIIIHNINKFPSSLWKKQTHRADFSCTKKYWFHNYKPHYALTKQRYYLQLTYKILHNLLGTSRYAYCTKYNSSYSQMKQIIPHIEVKNVLICHAGRRELLEPAELKKFTNIVHGILNMPRLHCAYARVLPALRCKLHLAP